MTALILHGGAGARRERNYDREVVHMREVVEAMKARLDAGASALDVAVEAVVMLGGLRSVCRRTGRFAQSGRRL
jgi:beta-aspartyl-peptidase (threonine type)